MVTKVSQLISNSQLPLGTWSDVSAIEIYKILYGWKKSKMDAVTLASMTFVMTCGHVGIIFANFRCVHVKKNRFENQVILRKLVKKK